MLNANGLHLLAQFYDLFCYQFFFPFFLCFVIGLIHLHNTPSPNFELMLDSSNDFVISTFKPIHGVPGSCSSIGFNISFKVNGVPMMHFWTFSSSTATT